MALGLLTGVNAAAAQGPIFFDTVTLVGDGAYPSGGSTGLQAKLQTLRGDGRVIVGVMVADGAGFVTHYNNANDKLIVYTQDGSGALAEVTGDQSAITYKLIIVSK
jgi:hypothetical protein